MGELRGLSRWRARFRGIGLDEKLIDKAAEKAGIFLVQVERFMKVLSSAVQQVCFYLLYFVFSPFSELKYPWVWEVYSFCYFSLRFPMLLPCVFC